MMNILMTGGTGLLSRAFITKFTQHQYTVLTRSITKARQLLPKDVLFINNLAVLSQLDAYDAVINLAGQGLFDQRWNRKQKALIETSRWNTTQQLVNLIASSVHPPDVFISGSAVGIYGHRGAQPLSEAAPICQQNFASHLCYQWEAIAAQASLYSRVVHLRTGIVLTPEGGALGKLLLPFQWGLGGSIGGGKQYMSWIHIADQLNAMQYLLDNRHIHGAVNLVAPVPEPNAYFATALARQLARPSCLPMPEWLTRCMFGEAACLLLDSQRCVPQKLLDYGYEFSFADLEIAFADLLTE